MPAIFADLWNEVVDLKREVAHLDVALARTTDRLETDTQVAWEQTLMRASAIEKIYTGCERVMTLVAGGTLHFSSVSPIHFPALATESYLPPR